MRLQELSSGNVAYNGTGIVVRGSVSDMEAGLTLQAATGDVLYGTTYTGPNTAPIATLFAINAKNGDELWRKHIYLDGYPGDRGQIIDGALYLSAFSGGIYHLSMYDALTGYLRWKRKFNNYGDSFTVLDGIIYVSTSAFQTLDKDGRPYNSSTSGDVYVLRAKDGTQIWHYHTTARVSTPVIANGMAYISASSNDENQTDQAITAFDTTTGQIRWSRPVLGNVFYSLPAASKKFVYINTSNDGCVARN